jgi:hypothetical protein
VKSYQCDESGGVEQGECHVHLGVPSLCRRTVGNSQD